MLLLLLLRLLLRILLDISMLLMIHLLLLRIMLLILRMLLLLDLLLNMLNLLNVRLTLMLNVLLLLRMLWKLLLLILRHRTSMDWLGSGNRLVGRVGEWIICHETRKLLIKYGLDNLVCHPIMSHQSLTGIFGDILTVLEWTLVWLVGN